MYFEYRQGGGKFKNFWAATPISINEKFVDSLTQVYGENIPGEIILTEQSMNPESFDD
jgi:hypothetical protein